MRIGSVRLCAVVMATGLAAGCSAEERPAPAVAVAEETAPVASQAGEAAAAFPIAFRGNWDYDDKGCANGEYGTRFAISENQIIGHEDTSVLHAVQIVDELTIRVLLENQSADGTARLEQIMRLSPVAGISLQIERGDQTIRAIRCDPV